jgi:hypothetical protein
MTSSSEDQQQESNCSSRIIGNIADELSFAPYTPSHRLLGEHLARLIQLIMAYRPLTRDEINAIHTLADRRLTA